MPPFKKYKLSELCSKIGSGATPRGGDASYKSHGISLVRSQNILDFTFSKDGLAFIDEEQANELSNVELKDRDVLLNITGDSVARVCQVLNSILPARVNQHVAILRANRNVLNPEFLKYYLLSRPKKEMLLTLASTGATRKALTKGMIEEFEIEIPDEEGTATQTRIASILSSLDDKIELNRRINHTLEQIAQTLFKKYFVDDIDPENLPEGWKKVPIGEIVKYAIGGDWGKEGQDELHTIKVAVIRGTDFNSVKTGYFTSTPMRFIKETNYCKRKLVDGDILLEISGGSTDQPTGRNFRVSEKILNSLSGQVVPASFCRLIRPANRSIGYYLFFYLQILYDEGGTWEYQNQSTGISNFQFTYFTEKEIICIPTDERQFDEFAKHVEPILDKIDSNILEINRLTKVRDSLLPKLMSGEIEVNAAEKELVN